METKKDDSKSGCMIEIIALIIIALLIVAFLKCSDQSAIDLIRP